MVPVHENVACLILVMRWSTILYDQGVLTRAIVAAAMLTTASRSAFNATDFAEHLAVQGRSVAVQRATLRKEDHAFELQYPRSYDVTARHPLDPSYEETFYFRDQSSPVMYLQVIDLRKYLPKTNAPNESAYLKSQRQLPEFKSIAVDGKNGYQYLSCGRAACELVVMFIQSHREYRFVAGIKSDVYPKNASLETLPVAQQEIIRSIRFLDESGQDPQNRSK